MSDIFNEVEEEVRRERMEKLWKRYGDYVIAAAAVLVIGVAGYKLWQHYHFVETQKASAGFLAAMEMTENGKTAEAAAAFSKLAESAPSGYAETAELAAASAMTAAGKPHAALAAYRKIIAKHNDEIGATARVRAAWLLADTAKKSEVEELLEPFGDKSGWRYMAREILAYIDFRDGRLEPARAAFDKLAADENAPGAIRQRAKALASMIRTGINDYGTVPEPEVPADATDKAGAQPAATTDKGKTKP